MQVNSTQPQTQQPNIRASIFYINDMHAQYPRMPEIKYEADTFELTKNSNPDVDTFVLAGGDSFIGKTKVKNKMVSPFLNQTRVEYSAMGNHDVDQIATLQDLLKQTNTTFLAANLSRTGDTPFDNYIGEKKIATSTVVEKNGHKYGIIGAAPFKLSHAKQLERAHLKVDTYEKTRDEIQAEATKLKEQGIDKVILVSHIGYENDMRIAKEVSGLDVIVGGHSHDLIKGLKSGQNLHTGPDGNPVIIVQSGQNGEYTGKLDVVFTPSGQIIAATNKVKETKDSPKSLVIKFFEDRILGKAKPLGTITRIDQMKGNSKVVENPYANFFADAVREELGADVVLMNSAGLRGKLNEGPVTDLDLKNLFPFEDQLYKVELSEQQIVDALKDGVKSIHNDMLKPGLLQVSGIRYEIDKKGNLEEVKIQGKDGKYTKIDIDNPSKDKKYTAIVYDFLVSTSEYPHLKDAKILQKYSMETEQAPDIVMKHLGKTGSNDIQIKCDGRIENELFDD